VSVTSQVKWTVACGTATLATIAAAVWRRTLRTGSRTSPAGPVAPGTGLPASVPTSAAASLGP
jgi:hypothetical protein